MSIDRKRIEKFKTEITKYDDLPEHMKLDENYEELVKDINKYYQEVQDNIKRVDTPDDYIDPEQTQDLTKDEFTTKMKRINTLRSQIMTDKKSTNKLTNLYMELYGHVDDCKKYLDKQKMEIEPVE